jgi:hypothetical protein
MPVSAQELRDAFELIESMPLAIGQGPQPHTASFLDDNEDTGIVVFQDANGVTFMSMPYEDYLALRKVPPYVVGESGVLEACLSGSQGSR